LRYAIYLTPRQDDPLAEAARRWLGRCAFTGATSPPEAPAEARPQAPARYGFHATMRAPFRLREGVEEADLLASFASFCERHPPLAVGLRVARLSRFVALVAEDDAQVCDAAAATLRAFEPFRAPLTEAERARRRPGRLDERGRELLETWGYPHVMERFTFHMTLSGPVEDDAVARVERAAAAYFAPFTGRPQTLVFALFKEVEPEGPFAVMTSLVGADR